MEILTSIVYGFVVVSAVIVAIVCVAKYFGLKRSYAALDGLYQEASEGRLILAEQLDYERKCSAAHLDTIREVVGHKVALEKHLGIMEDELEEAIAKAEEAVLSNEVEKSEIVARYEKELDGRERIVSNMTKEIAAVNEERDLAVELVASKESELQSLRESLDLQKVEKSGSGAEAELTTDKKLKEIQESHKRRVELLTTELSDAQKEVERLEGVVSERADDPNKGRMEKLMDRNISLGSRIKALEHENQKLRLGKAWGK